LGTSAAPSPKRARARFSDLSPRRFDGIADVTTSIAVMQKANARQYRAWPGIWMMQDARVDRKRRNMRQSAIP
jgi:hypothetical protein